MVSSNGNSLRYLLFAIIISLTGWGLLEIVQTKTEQAALHTQVEDIKMWMQKLDAKIDKALEK